MAVACQFRRGGGTPTLRDGSGCGRSGVCARILYMQTLPLAEVRARLSALVDEVERTAERITITRNGVPVAVVLSVDDLAALEETLAWLDSPEAIRRAGEADAAVAAGDLTGRDEMAELMAEKARRRPA
jgi:antitoxin YefM